MPPWDIGRLTRYQFVKLYNRQLFDKDGNLIPRPGKEVKVVPWQEDWFWMGVQRGWPDWRIRKWIRDEEKKMARQYRKEKQEQSQNPSRNSFGKPLPNVDELLRNEGYVE